MRLKQRGALAIVESAIEVDSLDVSVKIVATEGLREGAASGVAVFETAHHQCVTFVPHACVERDVGVERSGSTFGHRVIEVVDVLFATVVGPQVRVCADLNLLRKQFDNISSKERVTDSFEPFRLELRPEMVEDRVRRWRVFAGVTQCRD